MSASEPADPGRSTDRVAGLGLLFGALYFVQGLGDPASGLIAQPVRALLKSWGENPAALATFMALMGSPWWLKPLLGLLSDRLPLFGSRRRNYLLLSSAVTSVGLLLLWSWIPQPGHKGTLLILLLLPTLGIAFSDVLIDALMIEEGQPRGLTGRFQSIQWSAGYGALLLAGAAGGFFSGAGNQQLAFGLCAALWAFSLMLCVVLVRERTSPPAAPGPAPEWRPASSALAAPGLLSVVLLMFIYDFNPMWVSVLYLHMTETVGHSEQAYGSAYSVFSGGCMLASMLYGFYCRRLALRHLATGAVVAGILANLVYLLVARDGWLYPVSLLAGLAYMSGAMVLLDLAARLVPLRYAASLFALVMAAGNLGSSLSEALGGWLYQTWTTTLGEQLAFQGVLLFSCAIVASGWLLLGRLAREIPQQWNGIAQSRSADS